MRNLLDKFKPILKEEGVFYSPPGKKGIKCTIVLEDLGDEEKKHLLYKDWRDNGGKMMGFYAYHKLTSEPYDFSIVLSKKVGIPGKHIIMETDQFLDPFQPVGYASNLKLALNLAHNYILEKILKEVLNPDDVYTNLLDKTKIGIEKFKTLQNNKANLSAKGAKE